MTRATLRRRTAQSGACHGYCGWVGVVVATMVATLAAFVQPSLANDTGLGPFGPEGPRLREQFWMVPSADAASPMRATVFRPSDAVASAPQRRPLVVINHGTSESTRLSVSMPVYYWLSRWFVEHGYVVLLPQRRGHGATAGDLVEAVGNCADPDHFHSGLAAAADIEAAMNFMSGQAFVDPDQTVVVGISSGGWASLALASQNPRGVRAAISFAGGRGGRAFGRTDGTVCGEHRLVEAAKAFGTSARVPTLWLYAENDSYFRPRLARKLASAWTSGGGFADLHMFGAYGVDGHTIADDRAGWNVWGHTLEAFLDSVREAPVATLAPETSGETASDRGSPQPVTDPQPVTQVSAASASGGAGTNKGE